MRSQSVLFNSVLDSDIIKSTTISGRRIAVFNALSSSSEFHVSVQAKTHDYNGEGQKMESTASLKSWLLVITVPNPPSTPNLVDISYHSAVINWSPPRIAVGAILLEYHLKYVKMNNFGNETILGSEMIIKSYNNTYASIKSLMP